MTSMLLWENTESEMDELALCVVDENPKIVIYFYSNLVYVIVRYPYSKKGV